MPKNITRVDSYTSHGWLVRFQRRKKGHSKFFSDHTYGGVLEAECQAKTYLEKNRKPGYSISLMSVLTPEELLN